MQKAETTAATHAVIMYCCGCFGFYYLISLLTVLCQPALCFESRFAS